MSERIADSGARPRPRRLTPVPSLLSPHPPAPAGGEAMPCDRCGAAMFRMHAVWRCPACGFKSDCCGW